MTTRVWRQGAQRREQRLRVMVNRAHTVVTKQRGKNLLQYLAVSQHVRDATRHTEILFQNRKATIRQAHQICSADADVDSIRQRKPAHLAPEMAAAINQLARNDAVRQYSALMVNIFQKKVQGRDSLCQPILNP